MTRTTYTPILPAKDEKSTAQLSKTFSDFTSMAGRSFHGMQSGGLVVFESAGDVYHLSVGRVIRGRCEVTVVFGDDGRSVTVSEIQRGANDPS